MVVSWAMWTIIATLAITGVVIALTYFLVGPYRHPGEPTAPDPGADDHGDH